MKIGTQEFETTGKTYVMGILNVTPDSFFDGGRYDQLDAALKHVEEMCRDGMDMLDIGGESTRPGHTPVPAQLELERVLPVIEAVKARFDVPIALDTSKSAVAEAGILSGADLINDVWGLKHDPEMAKVIARYGVACCLMHNRQDPDYRMLIPDLCADLEESLALADEAGIDRTRLSWTRALASARPTSRIWPSSTTWRSSTGLELPILLGTSRKSVIGMTLETPPEERLEGTLVTTVLAVEKGCSFVRSTM